MGRLPMPELTHIRVFGSASIIDGLTCLGKGKNLCCHHNFHAARVLVCSGVQTGAADLEEVEAADIGFVARGVGTAPGVEAEMVVIAVPRDKTRCSRNTSLPRYKNVLTSQRGIVRQRRCPHFQKCALSWNIRYTPYCSL